MSTPWRRHLAIRRVQEAKETSAPRCRMQHEPGFCLGCDGLRAKFGNYVPRAGRIPLKLSCGGQHAACLGCDALRLKSAGRVL